MSTFVSFVRDWCASSHLDMPAHHLEMAQWLEDQWRGDTRQALLLAFRHSGKSTLVGLFCAWLFLQNASLRIMVLAADYALAKKMVRHVKRLIEYHPDLHHLKPTAKDQWASDQFTIVRAYDLRDPSMLARGVGGNITGLRADVIICDDVEVPKNCDTALKRQDLRDKLLELDYVLTPGGFQLYIGTPHTKETIYQVD